MTDEQNTTGHNGDENTAASASSGQTSGNDEGSVPQIEQELQEAKNKLQEMTIFAQRALADLQNFKRRADEEKSGFISFANVAMLSEFIPVIDNIHRSLEHEPKDIEWAKGVEQTLRQFIQTLEKIGLKTIETNGQPFNPNIHDALLTGPGKKDTVIQELEKGYSLNDKVIKRARVKVGNGEE